MTAKELHGICPYLVSPTDAASGHVRERSLRALASHLIAQAVHGLSPPGSSGEFAYLTFEQRCEIARISHASSFGWAASDGWPDLPASCRARAPRAAGGF